MRKDSSLFALWLALTIVFAAAALVVAASTNTVTYTNIPGQDMKIVRFSWHDNDTAGAGTNQFITLNGFIHQVITVPHVDSTVQPTDNYDVYIYHSNDTTLSLLGTNLENRDTANTEIYVPATPVYAKDVTISHINNAVLDATGAVDIYVHPTR